MFGCIMSIYGSTLCGLFARGRYGGFWGFCLDVGRGIA